MKPTRYFPGSPEKVEVLRRRASTFFRLWHPLDAKTPRVPDGSLPLEEDQVVSGWSEEALSANYIRFLKTVCSCDE